MAQAKKHDTGRSRSIDAIAERLERSADRAAAEQIVTMRRRKADKKHAAIADEAFTAVQGGRKPDLTGHDALGVVHVVDPFEEAKASSKGQGAPPPLPKLVALRDDPVGQMHKRGQLDGDASGVADVRLKAARYLQALYEIVEIGGAKAMDPGKPVISGGKPCEPDIDARRYAAKRLIEIEADLAKRDKELLRLVLWQKMSLKQVAALYGMAGNQDISGLGFQFRACLDVAAEHVGIQHTASGARRRRDAMDAMASYASEPKLYAAVHRAKSEA